MSKSTFKYRIYVNLTVTINKVLIFHMLRGFSLHLQYGCKPLLFYSQSHQNMHALNVQITVAWFMTWVVRMEQSMMR